MKKVINIWIWFCLYLAANGQSAQYFNKTYTSFAGSSSISTVVQTDSNYLLVIDNLAPPQPQNTIFILADKYGNIMDSIQYPGAYKYSFVYPGATALKTETGNFVIATNRNDTNNFLNPHLFCLDTNLDTLWTRQYTHPDTLAVLPGAYCVNTHTAIRQTWDGGFIITGNYSKNCDQNQMRSYLLKTDSLGVMEWIRKYNGIQRISSIITSPDSGFFFPAYYSGQMSVIKTDPLGNIQWSVGVNSNTNPSFPSDLAIQDDSNLIVVSAFWYDLTWNLRAITVAKVNFVNPAKIWEKNYYLFRNFKCIDLHQTVSIHTLSDASIVIGGTSKLITAPNPYKGVMMKLSPDGDSLWARYYGYGAFKDACQFEHMIPTDDGGFLAVGFYYPMAPSKPWLVKMDSLGCDTPGCHLISTEDLPARQHGDMTLYPNPFSHELNIALPNGSAGATATLYDMQGRIMQQTRIPEYLHTNHYTLQTNDLSPGIYILHLVTRDGVTHVGRVVRGR